MTGTGSTWVDAILSADDPAAVWTKILATLREAALSSSKGGALDRSTVAPDRLIANTAWDLWDDFQRSAPTSVDELKKFWVQTTASGTAVLLLDALSLRELPLIVTAAEERGLTPPGLKRSALKFLQIRTALPLRLASRAVRSFSTIRPLHLLFLADPMFTLTCLMPHLPIAWV
jgi:hypothetical protein